MLVVSGEVGTTRRFRKEVGDLTYAVRSCDCRMEPSKSCGKNLNPVGVCHSSLASLLQHVRMTPPTCDNQPRVMKAWQSESDLTCSPAFGQSLNTSTFDLVKLTKILIESDSHRHTRTWISKSFQLLIRQLRSSTSLSRSERSQRVQNLC